VQADNLAREANASAHCFSFKVMHRFEIWE
jgi:hypothetical protein